MHVSAPFQVTWKDKVGIEASAAETASSFLGSYENDDVQSFGAYRERLRATLASNRTRLSHI